MPVDSCQFETSRLAVEEWHLAASRLPDNGLAPSVARILTEAVTRTLPAQWQGAYSIERAEQWIAERDAEGTTLLATDKATGDSLGLLIVVEAPNEDGFEVRLGYLLGERSWGKGLATELVDGFVEWCRAQPSVRAIAGGVAAGNPASRRVLEKNGFRSSGLPAEEAGDEVLRLELRP